MSRVRSPRWPSRVTRLVALVVTVLLVVVATACSGGGGGGEPADGITVFSELRGEQAVAFEAVLAEFTSRSGVPVRSTGTSNFEIDLVERIQNNDAPDVALVPQPGLIGGIVGELDALVPLPPRVLSVIEENYNPEWNGLLTFVDPSDGEAKQYGLFAQASAKSLVWYSPSQFAQRGYEVPTTMQELEALIVQMEADEERAWCVGLRDGSSSGWVGTDWIEDLVLRLEGADVYDDWITGDIRFTDDRIKRAFEDAGLLGLRNPATSGPLRLIESTPVTDSIDGLVGAAPSCLMHRQASFAAAWLPEGTTLGPDGDIDVFPLPSADEGPPPMLLGGQVAVAFTDSDDVWQLMEYLADRDGAAAVWAGYPGYLAPQTDFPLEGYGVDFDREVAGLVRASDLLCFDGSDLMPPRVGVRAFWDEVMEWMDGRPLAVVLFEIQQAWSASVSISASFDDELTSGASTSGGERDDGDAGLTESALIVDGVPMSACAVVEETDAGAETD